MYLLRTDPARTPSPELRVRAEADAKKTVHFESPEAERPIVAN